MNNLKITVAIILALILFSCKKESSPVNELVGEWELRESMNGFTGEITRHLPGNGIIMKFTSSSFEFLQDGSTVKHGSYTIRRYVSYITQKEESQMVLNEETDAIQTYFTVDATRLAISIDTNDGPGASYTRIK